MTSNNFPRRLIDPKFAYLLSSYGTICAEGHSSDTKAALDALLILHDYTRENDLIEKTRQYAERIQNGRTLPDIFDHLRSEVRELEVELFGRFWWLRRLGKPGRLLAKALVKRFPPRVGADGIRGETIDITTCALDLMLINEPSLTRQEIISGVVTKLDKWQRHYSNSIHRDRSRG